MSINHFRLRTSLFGLLGGVMLAPAPVLAQAAPQAAAPTDEIVVTAQRREEKQVDVPITITAIGGQALATANVQTLSDITKLTPGLRFDNASAFFQPTIRGVGTPVTTSGGGTNVGIYVDGFYSPNPLANEFQFLNVQSVQVLKGPQGTLFGHNTTGGAIVVQTADPSTTTKLDAKISYGRFNELRAQAYASTGLTKDIAFDIEGLYSRGDGYLTNIQTNDNKVGQFEDWTIRTGIKAQVTDNVSVMVRYTHAHVNDPTPALVNSYTGPDIAAGYPFFAVPGQYTFDPRLVANGTKPGEKLFIHTNSDVVQGTIKADLGFANFTSYTQYRKEKVDSLISLDYSGVEAFGLGLPNDNKTFTQELLLSSKAGSRLQWTAGMFYMNNRDTYITTIGYSGDNVLSPAVRLGGSSTTTVNLSGFLDATYEVVDHLFLTAGVRYSHDQVKDAYWNTRFLAPTYTDASGTVHSAPGGVVPVPDISSNHATPRVVVRYKPDDHSSIYASFARGYKAAIIDVGGSCQNAAPAFGNPSYTCNPIQPETIDAYEVGYKFDNHTFSFDLSGFYYNYRNLQVSAYLSGTAFILNAASSHIYGLDGQFTARLNEHFDLSAGAAWTHARFVEFDNAPVYVPCVPAIGAAACGANGISFLVPGTTLKNSTMERTPEFTGNITARYKQDLWNGKAVLSGNLNYTSKLYFGYSGNQFPQNGYATLDLRAEWTDPSQRYTIAVFGTNVTNTKYKTEVQATNFGIGSNWAKPISYGFELGVKF